MVKPEWGVKRVCQSCAAKFYDLRRSPITCPKCAAPFDPEALLKSRRSRPPPAKPEPRPAAAVEAAKPPEGDAKPDDDSGKTADQPGDDDATKAVVPGGDDG